MPTSTYQPAEDIYRDHRCQCLHLEPQHRPDGSCPWCDCERYVHWSAAA